MARKYFNRTIFIRVIIYTFFFFALLLLRYFDANSDWHDFDVFYEAASTVLSGRSMYVIVGEYNLPFWYPPWVAWFYVPFALGSKEIGLVLYKAVSLLSALLIVRYLTRYYQPYFKFDNQILILSFLIPMSLQLVAVGQMDYILLGLLVLIILAVEKKKTVWVGLLYPFLLVKPHLIIPFSIFLFLRSGKQALLISMIVSFVMLMLETWRNPGWHLDMFNLLQTSGQRIDGLKFITLPSLLGRQENWIGTANLPFTLLLIILAVIALWFIRGIPIIPFFSIALSASLFCAPRAYAYDLPLLIPAVIWWTAINLKNRWWLWVVIGLFPVFVSFSQFTHLLVLLVFVLCLVQIGRNHCSVPIIETKG